MECGPKISRNCLEISPKTVDTYRANIMRKLEVDGIAGLVKFAIQRKPALHYGTQLMPGFLRWHSPGFPLLSFS